MRTSIVVIVAGSSLGGCLLFETPLHETSDSDAGRSRDAGMIAVGPCASPDFFVSTEGNDQADGTMAAPLRSINAAFARASPGTCIRVLPGTYREDVVTSTGGVAGAPLRVEGSAGVVIVGASTVPLTIRHDHVHFLKLEIDGFFGATVEDESSYRDTLIDVAGRGADDPIVGVRLERIAARRALGDCIRLRYFVTDATFTDGLVASCGLASSRFGRPPRGGAAIVIGTRLEDRGQNPTSDIDRTSGIQVRFSVLSDAVRCIEIGEGATSSAILDNTCQLAFVAGEGAVRVRGSANTITSNRMTTNRGFGVVVGGTDEADGTLNGLDNTIRCNRIEDNAAGIRFDVAPQGDVCGNTMVNNRGGDAVGPEAASFMPTQACSTSCVAPD